MVCTNYTNTVRSRNTTDTGPNYYFNYRRLKLFLINIAMFSGENFDFQDLVFKKCVFQLLAYVLILFPIAIVIGIPAYHVLIIGELCIIYYYSPRRPQLSK